MQDEVDVELADAREGGGAAQVVGKELLRDVDNVPGRGTQAEAWGGRLDQPRQQGGEGPGGDGGQDAADAHAHVHGEGACGAQSGAVGADGPRVHGGEGPHGGRADTMPAVGEDAAILRHLRGRA